MGKPKGKGKTALKIDPAKVIKNKGMMVKIYNWSPLQHVCQTCARKLGNGMAVMHKGEYYCNWNCSRKADD